MNVHLSLGQRCWCVEITAPPNRDRRAKDRTSCDDDISRDTNEEAEVWMEASRVEEEDKGGEACF